MNANKWVARVDFEKEDQFLLMVFVTRLKEEIHCEVQILEPKNLSEAVEFVRFQERKRRLKQAQLYVQLESDPPSYRKGADIITQAADRSPYHYEDSKSQVLDGEPEEPALL